MNAQSMRLWRVLPALVVVLSLLAFGVAMAGAPEMGSSAPQAPTLDPVGPAGADDLTLDVGSEAQGDAPPAGPGGSDLPAANGAAWNFYTQMRNAGYTGAHDFYWTDWNSWEIDFKRAALGGIENSMIDNVDIGYYHDHGNGGVGEWFPWDHTDNWLTPNDCLGAYGDKDLEWLAIGGCSTFSDALRPGWANCLVGTHLLLGYKTTAYDANWGGIWADQMLGWEWLGIWWRPPKTVTQAWFTQCDQTQPSSVTARVIAEDWRHFSDKVWNRGGQAYGDIVDNTYWWMDHNCYKPPPQKVDASILAVLAEMPSYQVVDRTVTASYAQGIANALGLEGQVQLSPDGTQFALNDDTGPMTGTLSVELGSGGYLYQNLGQLWVPPTGPLSLPTEDAAVLAGNSFLDANAQALPGVQYANQAAPTAMTEKLSELAKGGTGLRPEVVLQTSSTDVMVAYGRTLAPVGRTANGAAVNLDVSVAGPGGTTKLYYGGQGGAAYGPGLAQAPIALAGGSRDVVAGTTSIPISTADKAWEAFMADHQLAVVTVPMDADQIIRKPALDTFSYYEQPHSVPQQELIPVWVFTADFLKGGEIIGADVLVYVPAAADYYPPDVAIDSPLKYSSIPLGSEVNLMSTATGGYAPFTFEWSTNKQGVVGTAEDTTFTLTETLKPGQGPTPTTIMLKVTNGNGQSRTVSVVVNPLRTWLPLIHR